MNLSVGLMEKLDAVDVGLGGTFRDADGKEYPPGRYRFDDEVDLRPIEPSSASFALDNVTIGIGFHWERKERQVFRGGLRIIKRDGLTLINDVPLEEYVRSVISSEMSATCPIELLKAHAVISRSWMWYPKANPESIGPGNYSFQSASEVLRWYGREAHQDFDVCADDHCQRYQGITKVLSAAATDAVSATAGQMLRYEGKICDARFSKCCGGVTEEYSTAWEDRDVPYLVAVEDPYCDTNDRQLLAQVLPGFDQETKDFYRWTVMYSPDEIRELVQTRLNLDLGPIVDLQPLQRGPSGRIIRLHIVGEKKAITVGKELEIRRVLSRSHLYSSAFQVERNGDAFVLRGSGWGHGVGLCQIGAAVMASRGKRYEGILAYYYPGTNLAAD